jgi:hypothetical protein
MSYIVCRFCHIRHIQAYTRSWHIGCCKICRGIHLPNYIPYEQWKQFLDKLHRKLHDTEKGLAEAYTEIFRT